MHNPFPEGACPEGLHQWEQNPYGKERCRECEAWRWCPSTDTGPAPPRHTRTVPLEQLALGEAPPQAL